MQDHKRIERQYLRFAPPIIFKMTNRNFKIQFTSDVCNLLTNTQISHYYKVHVFVLN